MTSPTPPPGDHLLDGRYRVEVLLGSGAVAEVYRAFDERLHRDVAIKLFRADVADELRRHEAEMRTLARLDHPSLVTVLDAGEDDQTGRPYLVMTLVEGPTLAEELRYGALPSDRVAEIGTALADALSYVHSQGLIHRDVKPANVLISSDGRVHLADFGIARLVDASHVTTAGEVVGTPAYFAPEQVTGEPVGPPADVYALGLILLECLTGHREYDGPPLEAAMARVTRPPTVPASLPVAWRDLLGGMLARLPAGRLSAAQVSDRLRRLSGAAADATMAIGVPVATAGETVAMTQPTRMLPLAAETDTSYVRPAPPTQRPLWPWVLGAAVLVAIAVAVVLALSHKSNGPNITGPSASCGQGLPTLGGRVGSDLASLTDLVCKGSISAKASNALSPYLGQLASAVQNKDVTDLDAVASNMSLAIGNQEQAGNLTPQLAQAIGNALTLFRSDATRRLTPPTPTESPTPTPSPSLTPTPTPTPSNPTPTPPITLPPTSTLTPPPTTTGGLQLP
ncbi:MAG TPA: serine/threonine-protein kinase [Mycobacteriales bacterium]|nr:serine/threonine-protein kinase [Mycobacteriales bacterium]